MAYWVTVRDGSTDGKTLVSHASSEKAARTEAENRGFEVNDIIPMSADNEATELEKYEKLSVSGIVAFQIFCLTVGQGASLLTCAGCIPLTISMFSGASDSRNSIGVLLSALLIGALLFCISASMFIVCSYVKRQLEL